VSTLIKLFNFFAVFTVSEVKFFAVNTISRYLFCSSKEEVKPPHISEPTGKQPKSESAPDKTSMEDSIAKLKGMTNDFFAQM